MFKALKARLFRAFGDWAIQRAMRTPYTHITHDDGRPYMERFWLLRLGKSRSNESGENYPWFGIRVHHIQSGDDRVFHDHPWPFATLILRGGYTEKTPLILEDGSTLNAFMRSRHFGAGSFRRMPANQWHYLTLAPGEEAWTLFITGRKRQGWGFLVNGVKVPWRQYLAARASRAGQA
jgi:hypothetical protein